MRQCPQPARGSAHRRHGALRRPQWRGIPFAAPPTGALRWRSPQPLAAWAGVREATEFGSPHAQLDSAAVATLLRETSAEQLMDAYRPDQAEGIPDVPNVFGDGSVLPEGEILARLASADGHAGVPVLLGTNRDENETFLFATRNY